MSGPRERQGCRYSPGRMDRTYLTACERWPVEAIARASWRCFKSRGIEEQVKVVASPRNQKRPWPFDGQPIGRRLPGNRSATTQHGGAAEYGADLFLASHGPTTKGDCRRGGQFCKTPEKYKAWLQNLGHEHVLTTFCSYGDVSNRHLTEIMRSLGKEPSSCGAPAL